MLNYQKNNVILLKNYNKPIFRCKDCPICYDEHKRVVTEDFIFDDAKYTCLALKREVDYFLIDAYCPLPVRQLSSDAIEWLKLEIGWHDYEFLICYPEMIRFQELIDENEKDGVYYQ